MASGWLFYFLITQAVEIPIYLVGLSRGDTRTPWLRRVLVAFGASAVTHPIVWFVLQPLLMERLGYWPFVVVAEMFAWLAETLFLRIAGRMEVRDALLWALAANASSVCVGFLLHP